MLSIPHYWFYFSLQLHLALTALKHLLYVKIALQKTCKEVLKISFVFCALPQPFRIQSFALNIINVMANDRPGTMQIHFNFFNLELYKMPGTTYPEISEKWIGYWCYLEYFIRSNVCWYNRELVAKLSEERFQEEKQLF